MAEPAYVRIAGEYARQIRSGELRPGTQLRSYAELATKHGVSPIVVRQAVELLRSQGLVRSIERRGTFVADRPNLVRVSPERQLESPETTFGNESGEEVQVEREVTRLAATEAIAEEFGIAVGHEVIHTVTRATEDGRPISISDTYQLQEGDLAAAFLEETLTDRFPTSKHAVWLDIPTGELVRAVHQRFLDAGDKVLMISDVSYPRDRYEAFVFRMSL